MQKQKWQYWADKYKYETRLETYVFWSSGWDISWVGFPQAEVLEIQKNKMKSVYKRQLQDI